MMSASRKRSSDAGPEEVLTSSYTGDDESQTPVPEQPAEIYSGKPAVSDSEVDFYNVSNFVSSPFVFYY